MENKPELPEFKFEIKQTKEFEKWLAKLKNRIVKTQIITRIGEIAIEGFFGDNKYLRVGFSELRFHSGAGYRVYFAQQGDTIVILLHGGDKSDQQTDINKAIKILKREQADDINNF